MTGRAAGYCAGFPVPGFMNPGVGWGRGRGWRRGRARGWRWGWQSPPAYAPMYAPVAAPPTVEDERQMLTGQMKVLQAQLDAIQKRMAEMEKEGE